MCEQRERHSARERETNVLSPPLPPPLPLPCPSHGRKDCRPAAARLPLRFLRLRLRRREPVRLRRRRRVPPEWVLTRTAVPGSDDARAYAHGKKQQPIVRAASAGLMACGDSIRVRGRGGAAGRGRARRARAGGQD